MTNNQVKQQLLAIFSKEFNIESKLDIYDTESQPFQHVINVEYKGKDGQVYEAALDVSGTIFKNTESDYFHNPMRDGRTGENQGGSVFISSWTIDEVNTWLDDVKAPFSVSIDELYKLLD